MNQLVPMLMNFVEQQARPPLQEKVTEQLNTTKADLKSDLPNTIMNYLSGKDGNGGGGEPIISTIISKLGPGFSQRLSSVTNVTVDTATEGMDTLLTNGVLNIAKTVLTQNAGNTEDGAEIGGFNFDFLKSGKEGMVKTTMAASAPVIKQVSDNMANKFSSSFPAALGGAIQALIDENGGAGGVMGTAAGLLSKLMNMGGDGAGDQTVRNGGNTNDVQAVGGHSGGIQQLLQNLLAPKILLLIQPYMQKFEAKMRESLENELRTKVFSPDYIKQAVKGMLTGDGGENDGASAVLGGVMNAFMHNGSQKGTVNGQSKAFEAIGNLASSFLKNKG
ncbi:hypothetical protein BGX28_007214 [Mortierella sp. GBA30]|nr:hypothetical protein BGX28_007214 [Mortierella sp. GBA30]